MRSLWKSAFVDYTLLRKKRLLLKSQGAAVAGASNNVTLTIRSRRSTILPFFENTNFKIYNGNKYIWLAAKLAHVGNKFGDFAGTKKKCSPKDKDKKNRKKK
jgi:ribosomal protein S19